MMEIFSLFDKQRWTDFFTENILLSLQIKMPLPDLIASWGREHLDTSMSSSTNVPYLKKNKDISSLNIYSF